MKPTGLKFALLIVCALANVACVPVCKEKQYYSQDMPGCVMCPTAKCEDQYGPDIQRCKEACETKVTETPQVPASKNDTPKPTPTQPTETFVKSTMEKIVTPEPPLDHPVNLKQSEKTGSSENSSNLGLSFIVGVVVTLLVLSIGIVVLVAYRCRVSNAFSRVNSDEGESIEVTCHEPSAPCQESSPVTQCHQSESVHRDDDINGIQLPIPETETLRTTSKNEHRSRLLTGETEC